MPWGCIRNQALGSHGSRCSSHSSYVRSLARTQLHSRSLSKRGLPVGFLSPPILSQACIKALKKYLLSWTAML